jgi:hypothetical protein
LQKVWGDAAIGLLEEKCVVNNDSSVMKMVAVFQMELT